MRTNSSNGGTGSDDGFVLVVVMGLLLIASLVAATLMLGSRSQIQIAAALNTRAELETLADGLVRLTAFRLTLTQPDAIALRVPVDGTPALCRLNDVVADIRVDDVAGLIDINSASVDLLQTLFRGLGESDARASSLSAAIQDFRDSDDVRTENGAEALDYQQAGSRHGPKNAPFESVIELDQVPGMTPELLQTLRPFVTVESRSPILDLSAAPFQLLQILARGSSATGAPGNVRELASREDFRPPASLLTRFNPRAMTKAKSRVFAIDVTTIGSHGGRFMRHAVIQLAAESQAGFIILEWSSPALFGTARAVARGGADTPCVQFE